MRELQIEKAAETLPDIQDKWSGDKAEHFLKTSFPWLPVI